VENEFLLKGWQLHNGSMAIGALSFNALAGDIVTATGE
jgi:hypothetical protein